MKSKCAFVKHFFVNALETNYDDFNLKDSLSKDKCLVIVNRKKNSR